MLMAWRGSEGRRVAVTSKLFLLSSRTLIISYDRWFLEGLNQQLVLDGVESTAGFLMVVSW